jgi:hypothetical protein
MIARDLLRVGTVGLMAIPGMPLPALCALLFCTVLTSAPFSPARTALLPDILPGDKFVLGSAAGNITYQASQILGFVAGAASSRQDLGRRCRVVRKLGSYRPFLGESPAVPMAERDGAAFPLVGVGGRVPDRLRQPHAADTAAFRLASGLLYRPEGTGRTVRAFAARRPADGGPADGGHAGGHGGRSLSDQPGRRCVGQDRDDGLARRVVLRPAHRQRVEPAAVGRVGVVDRRGRGRRLPAGRRRVRPGSGSATRASAFGLAQSACTRFRGSASWPAAR